jgi:hypothetical protein
MVVAWLRRLATRGLRLRARWGRGGRGVSWGRGRRSIRTVEAELRCKAGGRREMLRKERPDAQRGELPLSWMEGEPGEDGKTRAGGGEAGPDSREP